MSDFDKRLSNMMNEEEHFPNMQSNWERLSPRLQPPQPLTTWYRKPWMVGIAASLCALAVSGMTYYLIETKRENTALRNEVVALKNKTQNIDNHANTNKNNISFEPSNGSNEVSNKPPLKAGSISAAVDNKKDSGLNLSTENELKSPEKESEKTASNASSMLHQDAQKTVHKTTSSSNLKSSSNEKNLLIKSIAENKNLISKKIDSKLDETVQAIPKESTKIVEEKAQTNDGIEHREVAIDRSVDAHNSNISNQTEKADLALMPLTKMPKITSSIQTNGPLSMEGLLMQSPAIMRTVPRKGRFAIGVQAFSSFGEDEGRDKRAPALTGFGIVASYDLGRNLELMTSVDIGEMRYDFRERPKGLKTPDEPKAPPMHKLKRVSGDQNRQQFSIGLKYKIPTNTILTPSFNVGYDIQRVGKQTCRFDFLNETTNSELSLPEVVAPQVSNNLWHMGVGLETQISSFVIGLSTEYQKDFSVNNDSRIVVRGGVKYRF
jgi:hypothetical protein